MGLKFLLFPIQWGYIVIVSFRKLLYVCGIKHRHSFQIPVICIGNLAAGGSGKTPHTKYFAKLLQSEGFNVAIILRGYKRKSKGFIHCNQTHTVDDIGDEAFEYIHGINSEIKICVCANRKFGINEILRLFPNTDVVLMDDGFQHLAVKAGMNILLTDYLRPFYKNHVLPVGNLRELKCAKNRADIIMVTKTPKVFSPIIAKDLIDKVHPARHQQVAFSYLKYGAPIRVFDDSTHKSPIPTNLYSVFLISGISNPYPLEEHLKRNCVELYKYIFPDHHSYSKKEIRQIIDNYHSHLMKSKVVFTTEKDVARLMIPEIKEKLIDLPLYYIPVNVGIHDNKNVDLDKLIIDYVRKNHRNR